MKLSQICFLHIAIYMAPRVSDGLATGIAAVMLLVGFIYMAKGD